MAWETVVLIPLLPPLPLHAQAPFPSSNPESWEEHPNSRLSLTPCRLTDTTRRLGLRSQSTPVNSIPHQRQPNPVGNGHGIYPGLILLHHRLSSFRKYLRTYHLITQGRSLRCLALELPRTICPRPLQAIRRALRRSPDDSEHGICRSHITQMDQQFGRRRSRGCRLHSRSAKGIAAEVMVTDIKMESTRHRTRLSPRAASKLANRRSLPSTVQEVVPDGFRRAYRT